jgi:hypothetical protein
LSLLPRLSDDFLAGLPLPAFLHLCTGKLAVAGVD